MGRDFGFAAALAAVLALPGVVAFTALFCFDSLDPVTASVGAAASVLLALLVAVPCLVALGGARAAIVVLLPDAVSAEAPARAPYWAGPLARAIWPAVRRLARAWREHAADAERRFVAAEAVIAAVPDPLILIDAQRRIVRGNAAAVEFIGRDAEGRDLAAALRNPVLLAGADAILRGGPARSVEFTLAGPVERVMRAEIARIAQIAQIAQIDWPALRGAAAILTLHDVTALKRGEQMRADFIANAGHELKTPLTALIGFIETLRGPARDDAAAHDRFLGIMHEQAQRMARLVGDLLSLSRIELNEHVVPTDRVGLAAVVDEVARGLELRAAERGIQIVRALPADFPEVRGSRDELTQIFQNLLDNALKYGHRNSTVTVTGGVAGTLPAPLVWVAVADHGDGIPSEHLMRLTERFYRVDTARSRELGGTGLGLAIVKHILNRHRGRLDITSTVGQGSTFTVWLRY
ncbi:MAG TPA: ATP-binding protein [Stellaceae bacterium]|jgi:two-component system phosphate regulon sensor histidine kinase PhoR|nr:ATP-binding protein [Stellaceae bacterium]